jgi:putative membrane protein
LTITGFTSEGLTIESLGWAILGAIVMSLATMIARFFFKLFRIL